MVNRTPEGSCDEADEVPVWGAAADEVDVGAVCCECEAGAACDVESCDEESDLKIFLSLSILM